MHTIDLTKGYVAYVDDCDAILVSPYKWTLLISQTTKAYATASINGERILLHRFLLGLVKYDPRQVDHKDNNGLNCVRDNMRICTRTQNTANTGLRSNNKTGYKGVVFNKNGTAYKAQVQLEGTKINLGMYTDPIEAALAYDDAAKKLFGEFAKLNFPEAA